MDVAQLGIQVTSGPAVKGAADLDKLTVAAAKAEDQVQDLAAASGRLSPTLGKVSGAATALSGSSRMLAQQLSQVGQMTMVTGNFAQALAVQLPDIGLAFGTIGAAAGLVAGVALPALIAAFSGADDGAERLREELERGDDAVSAYAKAAEAALQPNEKLIESYGRLSGAAGAALDAISDIRRIEAINAVSASIQTLSGSLLEAVQNFGRSGTAGTRLELADDFGLAADQAIRLRDGIISLQNADGLQNQAIAAQAVADQLRRAFGSVDQMPEPLRETYSQLSQIVVQAGGVQGALDKSNSSARSLAATASTFAGYFSAAESAAWGLAGAIGGALEKAQALAQQRIDAQNRLGEMAFEFSPGGQALLAYGSRAPGGNSAQNALANSGLPVAAGAAGGTGATVADEFAQRLTGIQEGLQTERETLDLWYQDAQSILADRRAQELLGEQGHKDLLLQVEREYQAKIAETQAAAQQQRLGDMASFWGQIANIASVGGQRTVKAVAAFQAVEGTVNAYGAAIKALNTPGITLWGRFAAYASVLGAGLKGVAAIRSAGGIGGGGGGSVSPGTPAAQAVTPDTGGARPTVIDVRGIDRNAIYTGGMWEKIFDGVFEEGRKRGIGAPILRFT